MLILLVYRVLVQSIKVYVSEVVFNQQGEAQLVELWHCFQVYAE